MERCPFLLGNPQDIDGRIGDMLFRRAGFAPVTAARSDNVLTLQELCGYGMGAYLRPQLFLPSLLDDERLRTPRTLDCGPGTSYAISFGISTCDYRWSAVDDFIDCAPPEHQQPLTGMIPAGTVGSRLIVVEHGLDVVAIGIMDERGIVARPIVRARTGLAVVGAAGRETRLMERLAGVGGLGAERNV